MANNDFCGFKKALALWAAKNNAMIDKYQRVLVLIDNQIDSLYDETPSASRDSAIANWTGAKDAYIAVLKDLKTPCDCIISELEFQNIGKENG